ncbi:MAG: nuclease [Acidobacteria bacterium]|nr:nuclease [Acidobacteriota bacterium]
MIRKWFNFRLLRLLLFATLSYATSEAQQPIGSVQMQDATVQGALRVANGRAILEGASTVIAKGLPVTVSLQQGGTVRICSTSGLHLNAGRAVAGETPLLLALDRGAVEIATRATANDVVMTPDLRLTLKSPGTLDLRLRVARNGDTCVDNRGAAAPVLNVADQFGEASYELHAGQHVLFERGSLKEVVDNESEPCGCPPEPVVSVADAGVSGGTPAAPGAPVAAAKTAAEQHPFPAAVSAGLAPGSALPPQAPAGQVHAQVSTTMSYGVGSNTNGSVAAGDPGVSTADAKNVPAAPSPQGATAAASTPAALETAARAQAPPPPPAPSTGNVFHSIGRFFKRLFRGR